MIKGHTIERRVLYLQGDKLLLLLINLFTQSNIHLMLNCVILVEREWNQIKRCHKRKESVTNYKILQLGFENNFKQCFLDLHLISRVIVGVIYRDIFWTW